MTLPHFKSSPEDDCPTHFLPMLAKGKGCSNLIVTVAIKPAIEYQKTSTIFIVPKENRDVCPKMNLKNCMEAFCYIIVTIS